VSDDREKFYLLVVEDSSDYDCWETVVGAFASLPDAQNHAAANTRWTKYDDSWHGTERVHRDGCVIVTDYRIDPISAEHLTQLQEIFRWKVTDDE
jgi:hypothetical protein